jgi:hypothetical protein
MSDQVIIDEVKNEISGAPMRSGDLKAVIRRGKTRRVAHHLSTTSGVVALCAMVVGFAFVASRSADPVASDGTLQLVADFDVPVFDNHVRSEGALVYQAKPGPALTGGDIEELGTEIVITPSSPEALVVPVSDNPINALQAEVIIYLGELAGAQLALHEFNGQVCVFMGNGTKVTGGGGCVTEEGLVGSNHAVDPPTGPWLAWTQLPESAAVVVGETEDGTRYWQRVIGRTVVLIPPDGPNLDPATLSALDAQGNEVASTRGKDLDLGEIGLWDPSMIECPPETNDGPVPAGC